MLMLSTESGNFFKEKYLDELLSMCEHRNGYRREKAVRRLGMLGNPLAIPKLIVRANDWVPQVRTAAREAILQFAIHNNAEVFVQCLPELYHLKKCGRYNHGGLIKSIETFLLLKENVTYLIHGINSNNSLVARMCVGLAVKKQQIWSLKLIKTCLKHSNVMVRAKASHLLRNLDGNEQNLALDIAIQDRFMPIRREAFQIILKRDGSNITLAKKFLFDRHSSIREIAIIHLKQAEIDVKSIYRMSLDSKQPSVLSCAIWGLAELYSIDSISQLNQFLKNPFPSVRKQAVKALAILDGSNTKKILMTGILDSSPAVSKEASRLANKYYVSFTAHNLLEIVNRAKFIHTLISCVTISKKINKWDRLIFLVSLLKLKHFVNQDNKGLIKSAIHQWDTDFNKSGIQPTKLQLDELSRKSKEVIDILKSYEYQTVLFTLNTLKIC